MLKEPIKSLPPQVGLNFAHKRSALGISSLILLSQATQTPRNVVDGFTAVLPGVEDASLLQAPCIDHRLARADAHCPAVRALGVLGGEELTLEGPVTVVLVRAVWEGDVAWSAVTDPARVLLQLTCHESTQQLSLNKNKKINSNYVQELLLSAVSP